jgi:hypothetical protein
MHSNVMRELCIAGVSTLLTVRIFNAGDAPALWIESKTTPAWVKNELEKMDRLASDIPPF